MLRMVHISDLVVAGYWKLHLWYTYLELDTAILKFKFGNLPKFRN